MKIAISALLIACGLAACAGANPAQALALALLEPCPAQHFSRLMWSPDGQRIALITFIQGQRAQIAVMNADGSNLAALTPPASDYVLHGWSPDSQTLSYTHGSGLFLLGLDSSVERVPVQGVIVRSVSWSPDGQRIVYAETLFTDYYHTYLYVADSAGGQPRRLTDDDEEGHEPVWLADGETIAFIRRVEDGYGVFTARLDGSHLTRIAHSPYGIGNLQQSPDGAWVSYVSKGQPNLIEIVRPDGSDARYVRVAGPESDYNWRPDSRAIIAYTPAPGAGWTVIDVETLASQTFATLLVTFGELPVWSPDGKLGAFVGVSQTPAPNGASPLEIYQFSPSGSGMRAITNNPGKRSCLRWPF